MEAYFILLIIIVVLLRLNKLTNNLVFVKSIFVILALFSGLRFNVGIDFENYLKFFDYVDTTKKLTKEPAFGYIVFYIKKWFGESQVFFLLFAILTQYFYYKFIIVKSKNKGLSILIYFCIISFYLYSFNAVRQTLAVSIFLFSLKYIEKEKKMKFLVINLFSALFVHVSVLFLLPIYFFVKRKNSFLISIAILCLSIFIGFSMKFIIMYTGYSGYIEKGDLFNTKVTFSVYLFLLLSLVIEFSRNKNKENLNERVFYNLNFIGACILFILISQDNSALILTIKRLHNYFLASYIILIPILIDRLNFDTKSNQIINFTISFILILIYSFYIINFGESNKLIPYEYKLSLI